MFIYRLNRPITIAFINRRTSALLNDTSCHPALRSTHLRHTYTTRSPTIRCVRHSISQIQSIKSSLCIQFMQCTRQLTGKHARLAHVTGNPLFIELISGFVFKVSLHADSTPKSPGRDTIQYFVYSVMTSIRTVEIIQNRIIQTYQIMSVTIFVQHNEKMISVKCTISS